MPLRYGDSKEVIEANVRELIDAGHEPAQAVAIAHEFARHHRLDATYRAAAHTIALIKIAHHVRPQRSSRGHFQRGHAVGRKPPRQEIPKNIEADYARSIIQLLEPSRAVLRELVDGLPALLDRARAARGDSADRTDASAIDELRAMIRRARVALDDAMNPQRLDDLARRYGEATSDHQRNQLKRQVQAVLRIDLVTADPKIPAMIDHFAHYNAQLITSLGDDSLKDVEKVVSRAFTTGQRAEDVAAEIADRYGITDRHARMIARDQIGTLNGQLAAARQQEIGVSRFTWRTVHDERVREEHALLDGEVFDYDSPPDEGLPGEPIMCRCSAEPVLTDILEAAAGRE
jgi:SPP1 gp7 family putative phage head morphogenesis protein